MTMRMLAAVAAGLVLTGCSAMQCGQPGPYMAAETTDMLVVPEGLATPDRSRQIRIPVAADVVHPELRGNRVMEPGGSMRCLEAPPPPRK